MDNFQIETAQNVNILQNVAGVGERIVAYLVDGLIMGFYVFIMIMIFANTNLMDEYYMLIGLTIGLPLFLYHLLWETLWNGRSPGKAVMKLRGKDRWLQTGFFQLFAQVVVANHRHYRYQWWLGIGYHSVEW